jgi:FixJ family two-component response regulator
MPSFETSSQTARPQVLLAEDDPAVRRSLQLLLHGQGYDVRSYASGSALLADPKARNAVCFVADYRMPGMDGVETFVALRGDGWMGPAVLLTAFPSAELKERAHLAGFSAILEKPLHERSLADALTRLLA